MSTDPLYLLQQIQSLTAIEEIRTQDFLQKIGLWWDFQLDEKLKQFC